MLNKIAWGLIATAASVLAALVFANKDNPVVAGIDVIAISLLAAILVQKGITPWGLIWSVLRVIVIGIAVIGGAILSITATVIHLVVYGIRAAPWRLIGLSIALMLFLLMLILPVNAFLRLEIPILWIIAGVGTATTIGMGGMILWVRRSERRQP